MIPANIDRMDDRLEAIFTAMKTADALSAYVKSRSYVPAPAMQDAADLRKGALMLISNGEGHYSKRPGMIAKNGLHNFIVMGHLKVDEHKQDRQAVEDAELDMIENIKTFVRDGIPGMSLTFDDAQNSLQQEHPYGWIYIQLTAGDPSHSIS